MAQRRAVPAEVLVLGTDGPRLEDVGLGHKAALPRSVRSQADKIIASADHVVTLGWRIATCVAAGLVLAAATVVQAQPSIDEERVRRARAFLSRFAESSCVNNDSCRSWMKETNTNVWDVSAAFAELEAALGGAARLQVRLARLQADVQHLETVRQQAEKEARDTKAHLDGLTRDTVDKALAILGKQHFGIEARKPADVVAQQMAGPAGRLDCGNQQVIMTLFGYFIYERELDVSGGEKYFTLTFRPFAFARGGSLGRAIDNYIETAKLSLQPQLEVAGVTSIAIAPQRQAAKPVHPAHSAEWNWSVRQPIWSSISEASGAVRLRLTSPDGSQDIPSLDVKVKGRPWYFLFAWVWTLTKLEVMVPLVAFAFVAYRRGIGHAVVESWQWLKEKTGIKPSSGSADT